MRKRIKHLERGFERGKKRGVAVAETL